MPSGARLWASTFGFGALKSEVTVEHQAPRIGDFVDFDGELVAFWAGAKRTGAAVGEAVLVGEPQYSRGVHMADSAAIGSSAVSVRMPRLKIERVSAARAGNGDGKLNVVRLAAAGEGEAADQRTR